MLRDCVAFDISFRQRGQSGFIEVPNAFSPEMPGVIHPPVQTKIVVLREIGAGLWGDLVESVKTV